MIVPAADDASTTGPQMFPLMKSKGGTNTSTHTAQAI
jgi:hypothetical protein